MKTFRKKRAFITGGSSGIGLATALMLVEEGADVWICGRSRERLDAALERLDVRRVNSIQNVGGLTVDVGDPAAVAAIVPQVEEGLGGVDLLINSAGIGRQGSILKLEPEDFAESCRVNYLGTVYVTQAFVPLMVAQRSGHVVNISSTAGFIGVFGYSPYTPTKFAVRGYSEVIRQELLVHGVDVTVVYPADTDTPMLQEEMPGRLPETAAIAGEIAPVPAEDVAEAILDGVRKRRLHVVPGLMNKLTWALAQVAPWIARAYIDRMIRSVH